MPAVRFEDLTSRLHDCLFVPDDGLLCGWVDDPASRGHTHQASSSTAVGG